MTVFSDGFDSQMCLCGITIIILNKLSWIFCTRRKQVDQGRVWMGIEGSIIDLMLTAGNCGRWGIELCFRAEEIGESEVVL